MSNNLFETAARKAYRYETNKGEITTEQLFDLPLLAKNQFDLNSVAVNINAKLKAITEESFVNIKPTPGKVDLENKLDIVKYIISVKQDEQTKAREAAEKAAKREKLVQALANQEDKELENLTPDEIRAKLAELD